MQCRYFFCFSEQSADTSEQPEPLPCDKKLVTEESAQPPSPNALKVAATECLSSWISYLQMLNSVCAAGLRLSQSLHTLAMAQNVPLAAQCQASWDELTKATSFASHTVKSHIAAAMHDLIIGEMFTKDDAQRQQVGIYKLNLVGSSSKNLEYLNIWERHKCCY